MGNRRRIEKGAQIGYEAAIAGEDYPSQASWTNLPQQWKEHWLKISEAILGTAETQKILVGVGNGKFLEAEILGPAVPGVNGRVIAKTARGTYLAADRTDAGWRACLHPISMAPSNIMELEADLTARFNSTEDPPNREHPMPKRLSEAVAAFLLNFPTGYDLPPLDIIIMQMGAALKAADNTEPAEV